ncbi:MAG TPA: hypothetical protein VGV12_08865 [Gemmatimonadales bacterium]|nr:hypothetical protein [Gemmatimonadales bacterium]
MEPSRANDPPRLQGELSVFLLAVIVGSLSGIATTMVLEPWVAAGTAGTAAVAVATTCTGATHARLAHGQPWMRLLPKIGVGAPLAFGVMRLVHLLLGS